MTRPSSAALLRAAGKLTENEAAETCAEAARTNSSERTCIETPPERSPEGHRTFQLRLPLVADPGDDDRELRRAGGQERAAIHGRAGVTVLVGAVGLGALEDRTRRRGGRACRGDDVRAVRRRGIVEEQRK